MLNILRVLGGMFTGKIIMSRIERSVVSTKEKQDILLRLIVFCTLLLFIV